MGQTRAVDPSETADSGQLRVPSPNDGVLNDGSVAVVAWDSTRWRQCLDRRSAAGRDDRATLENGLANWAARMFRMSQFLQQVLPGRRRRQLDVRLTVK